MRNTQIKIIPSQKPKGGRPPKSEDELMGHRQTVNFTDSEWKTIVYKASLAGKKEINYIHDAALSANVKPNINNEQAMQVRNLCMMGNNLNQIARRANQGGLLGIKAQCEQTVGRIQELVCEILRGSDQSSVQIKPTDLEDSLTNKKSTTHGR